MKSWQLILIAVKAALLVGGIARGEVVNLKVICHGAEYQGSAFTLGVLPDGRAAILTAAHVLKNDARAVVTWKGGQVVDCEILAAQNVDHRDVAVLAAKLPGVWQSVPLAVIGEGKELSCSATGSQYGKQIVRRDFTLVTTDGDGLAAASECRVVSGDSGGPIISKDLGVIGIIKGFDTETGDTVYTPAKEIASFLAENRITVDTRVRTVETQCRNGRCYTQPYGGFVIQSPALIVRPRSVEIVAPPPVIPDPRVTYPGQIIRKPTVPPPPREEPRPINAAPACQCKPQTAGAQGPPGLPGPRGPKGDDATCTCVSNRAELDAMQIEIKRLKETPIKVQIKENGKLVDEDVYAPGEPIILDLTTVE